ncbi:hypothetical protein QYE76_043698 [Lolium multiflorum]|uniref:MADS-box domain-containing protein n=1 Tax=Lolium multiflorum TaxID=4521 RepID=A0AAD8TH17_LOLMU|nr:hypothetical protein QYE76_043698 [Lolium multiflorum]
MARQRGPVVLRRIEDRRRRGICFRKRQAGLVKKAEELAVLCDADVALLVVSPFDGTFHRFAAPATYVPPVSPSPPPAICYSHLESSYLIVSKSIHFLFPVRMPSSPAAAS